MKKILLCLIVVSFVLLAPGVSRPSQYIGDWCWSMGTGITLICSVSLIGTDSNGFEIVNYVGRMKMSLGEAPVNGNCVVSDFSGRRKYLCNLLMTSGDGVATFYAEFDYYTLNGLYSAVFDVYDGYSMNEPFIPVSALPRIACP